MRGNRQIGQAVGGLFLCAGLALGADAPLADLHSPDAAARARAARKLGNTADGFKHIAALAPLVEDPVAEVRNAAVVSLIQFRSPQAIEPLIAATRDEAPGIQALAVDGLVDFYYPEYVKFGRLGSLKTFAGRLKGRFSAPSPVVIEPYVTVNPDAVRAIADTVVNGGNADVRANGARALGILRGGAGLAALQEGVRSRDSKIILESVYAIKKIADSSAGPDIVFLLRDLDEAVQFAVIQTLGQLRTEEARPGLIEIIEENANPAKIRREALVALAKIPDPAQRTLFLTFMRHKDKFMRAAAAEGIGRIGNPLDAGVVAKAFKSEGAESARLSLAFAAVHLGDLSLLGYLADGLNSTVHRMEARPFLVELARKPEVLAKLYPRVESGSTPQRRHLAHVIALSGDEGSVPYLQKLAENPNDKLAVAGIEALKVLQARLRL